MKRCIVIGTGFAGSVVAERLARGGYQVDVYEKRGHIGGNMYDYYDENGILCHQYGPHVFHTDQKPVWDYIGRFGEWDPYRVSSSTYIDGRFIPFHFNLNSLNLLYGKEKAGNLESKLVSLYGKEGSVHIFSLLSSSDEEIRAMAKDLYEKDLYSYTMKQWGLSPTQVDESVTARVPFRITRNNNYFTDVYQFMPRDGFHSLFSGILSNPNIKVHTNVDALNHLEIKQNRLLWDGEDVNLPVVFTGCADELFHHCFGLLPYRSLSFEKTVESGFPRQPTLTVCYPDLGCPYTRATEYRHIMNAQPDTEYTALFYETSLEYQPDSEKGNIPYYPIPTEENQFMYERYANMARQINGLYLVGRLAEYKYYNMDQAIKSALETAEIIMKTGM